jgi:hypothetical protein
MQSVMIVVEALFVVSSAFAKVRSVLATAPAPATSAVAPRAGVECVDPCNIAMRVCTENDTRTAHAGAGNAIKRSSVPPPKASITLMALRKLSAERLHHALLFGSVQLQESDPQHHFS